MDSAIQGGRCVMQRLSTKPVFTQFYPYKWNFFNSFRRSTFLRQTCSSTDVVQEVHNDGRKLKNARKQNDSQVSYSSRTHTCGELGSKHVGCSVLLSGWIQQTRMNSFIILRDAFGITQVNIPDSRPDLRDKLTTLTNESVVLVSGKVEKRPATNVNNKMFTGEIEVIANALEILSLATKFLPFELVQFKKPRHDLLMQYRYLFLRYPSMQRNLRLRSHLLHRMRDFLIREKFVDVETPTLFRKTPGGAQEFVVPTQISGMFYSLVQSPQQFKQLLMVGGIDRYFQIARCYRDESTRSDRQPEFTQLDVELSFVTREGVMSLIEDLLAECWPSDLAAPDLPFPKITYKTAMETFGTDKPDARFNCHIVDVTGDEVIKHSEVQNFSVQALLFPGFADKLSRSQRNELINRRKESNTKLKVLEKSIKDERWEESLSKAVPVSSLKLIKSLLKPNIGDTLIVGMGNKNDLAKLLGKIRLDFADRLEEAGVTVRTRKQALLWVTDFPLFEKSLGESLQSVHHPFTQPHPEDAHLVFQDPLKVRGLHYDLVFNGQEIGGGSIRISDAVLQESILRDVLRVDPCSLQHLLTALACGCPPHGGIALGIDRLLAILCETNDIRNVIAFPKGLFGKDIMGKAPAPLTPEDSKLYGLLLPSSS